MASLWRQEIQVFPRQDIKQFLKGFGKDLSGEIYALASKNLGPAGNTGKVFKLVAEKKSHK
jgi:hypothetical protein